MFSNKRVFAHKRRFCRLQSKAGKHEASNMLMSRATAQRIILASSRRATAEEETITPPLSKGYNMRKGSRGTEFQYLSAGRIMSLSSSSSLEA